MSRGLHRALQSAVNRALALDPELGEILAPLAGRSLEVRVEDAPGLDTLVRFAPEGVSLEPPGEASGADIVVSGTLSSLLALVSRRDPVPAGTGVSVQGDMGLLQQLRGAASRLRPDWREPIARVLGDELGHPLTRGIEQVAGLLARTVRELGADAQEFLREESGLLVGPEEVEDFAAEVDRLRDAVERLDKRVSILERSRPDSQS